MEDFWNSNEQNAKKRIINELAGEIIRSRSSWKAPEKDPGENDAGEDLFASEELTEEELAQRSEALLDSVDKTTSFNDEKKHSEILQEMSGVDHRSQEQIIHELLLEIKPYENDEADKEEEKVSMLVYKNLELMDAKSLAGKYREILVSLFHLELYELVLRISSLVQNRLNLSEEQKMDLSYMEIESLIRSQKYSLALDKVEEALKNEKGSNEKVKSLRYLKAEALRKAGATDSAERQYKRTLRDGKGFRLSSNRLRELEEDK
jgi:hypothetical protein